MFPRTLHMVLLVVGGVWIVQGFGLLRTGSFMDGRIGWALAGSILFVSGLAALLLRRRRDAGGEGSSGG